MTVAEVERIGAPEIPIGDAKAAYLSYRAALLRERNPKIRQELGTLTRSYKAIAAGKSIVDVEKALHAAGLQIDTFYPRLAICRADAEWCHVRMWDDGGAWFAARELPWNNRIAADQVVKLPKGTFQERTYASGATPGNRPPRWSDRARAMVPVVPPQYRPNVGLGSYHIMWDAIWTPEPPVDPLLLKHLGGPLFVVVAAWDLTAIERAVMRGRLR